MTHITFRLKHDAKKRKEEKEKMEEENLLNYSCLQTKEEEERNKMLVFLQFIDFTIKMLFYFY